MGLGMFTALPCPYRPWDEADRGLMLACLPVIGAVIGLIWSALSLLARALLPAVIAAAVITALPALLTGFIHLDGYMDTCDALLSWRPLEERRRILKDVHCGAYAVAGLVFLILFGLSAALSLGGADLRTLALIPVFSRCGSALCVTTLAPLEHSEYAALRGTPFQRAAIVAMGLLALVIGRLWLGRGLVVVAAVEWVVYGVSMAWAYHSLRGVSGDLAGFSLSLSETAALLALALV